VFSANEAYLIKNGKISHPVKGATLIGSGDEALKKISMVGRFSSNLADIFSIKGENFI
jgi:predicted Zn-dependent protease